MGKYQDGPFFDFKVDFNDRNNLYMASGYQIVSPTVFKFDSNKNSLY